jgi:hypothetical protein
MWPGIFLHSLFGERILNSNWIVCIRTDQMRHASSPVLKGTLSALTCMLKLDDAGNIPDIHPLPVADSLAYSRRAWCPLWIFPACPASVAATDDRNWR